MVLHKFDKQNGILYLSPEGRLAKEDFQAVTAEIDPYIREQGKIKGVLISAREFPFWKDFAALITHFKFVRNHQRQIEKVAIVSDASMTGVIQSLASHFLKAWIKHFDTSEYDQAEKWIRQGVQKAAS